MTNQTGETLTRENRVGLMSYLRRSIMLLFAVLVMSMANIGMAWGETITMSSIFTGSNTTATITSPLNATVSTTTSASNAATSKLGSDGNYFEIVLTDKTFSAASINGYINTDKTDKNWAFQFTTNGGTTWGSEVTQANDGTKSAHDINVGVTIPSGANGIRIIRRAGSSTYVYSLTLTTSGGVTRPTFSPATGSSLVKSSGTVTLTSAGNTVYYKWSQTDNQYASGAGATLAGAADGSGTSPVNATAPSTTGTWYLYAVAKDGGDYSNVVKATYTITNPTHTLTWNLDGGTATGGTAAGAVAEGATLTAPTVTKVGYDFAGWSSTVPATMPAADAAYTATWTKVYASGTYNFVNQGDGSVTWGSSHTVTLPAGTKTTVPAGSRVDNIFFSTALDIEYEKGAEAGTGYKGWKIKQSGKLAFYVENDCDVIVTNGIINGMKIHYYNQSNVETNTNLTSTAGTREETAHVKGGTLFEIVSTTTSTNTLKGIMVSSSCTAPTSPSISGTTTYTAGGTISLTASASGTNASTTYQWYKGDPDNGGVSQGAASTSGATFTKASCVVADGATYYCVISNGEGCTVTTSQAITVKPSVTVAPTNTYGWRYSIGETIDLTATPGGASSYTYQWQKYVDSDWADISDGLDATDGGTFSGTSTARLQITNCTSKNGGSYRCQVTGGGQTNESDAERVYVFTVNGNYYNTAWVENPIVWESEYVGTATISLEESRTYEFKVYNNDGKVFGYSSGNYIIQAWSNDCGTENSNIRLFTGPAGNYTVTVNIQHSPDNYVHVAVAYPSVTHPASGYIYVTDWGWDPYVHFWDGSSNNLTADGSDPKITTYTEICDNDYWYFPVLDNYVNFLVKDNTKESSATNKSGSQTTTSHSGMLLTNNGSWVWQNIGKTISFDANGGSGTMDDIEHICSGDNKTLPTNTITRTGWEFDGWNTNKYGSGESYDDGATIEGITSDITLYAQWKKTVYLEATGDYTWWYNKNGDYDAWYAIYYWDSSADSKDGWVAMELADCETTVYKATLPGNGYDKLIFVRKSSDKTHSWTGVHNQTMNIDYPTSNPKFSINDQHSCSCDDNNKLEGSWGTYSAPTWTISFAGNDNTGGLMSNISSIACDANQTITANAFTKTGYSFAGWTANVNVTIDDATVTAGTVINDEATIQNIRGDITLTAQWTAKSCTVEFNTNGGIGTITSVTATYDEAMPTKAGNLPTKAGYDFAGFWDGEGGSGTQYYNADGTSKINWDKNTTSNTTLYAKWTAHQYTITLDLEGGSGTTSVTATYNSTLSDDALFDAPTLSGYSFGGFYTSEAGGGSQLINENRKWNKSKDGYIDGSKKWIYDGEDNITLKAKWTQTVTLDDNGGSADGGATATYNSTSLSSISAPTYSGHTVDGYYTSANCTTKVATDAGALQASITVDEVAWTNSSSQWIKDGSAKFYAHWKCNTPTITDNGDNTVSITVPSGTTVRYTTDGTTPSSSTGTVYSDAFDIEEDVIVKAIAYQSGCTDSELASETCTYTAPGDGCWDPANTAADKLSSGDVELTTFENNFSGVSGITSVAIESKSASDIGGCSGEDGDERGYMKVKNVQNEGNKIITIVLSSAKDITIGGINYSSNSGDFYLVKSTDTSTELAKLTTDADGETATAENCVAGTYYIYAKTATNNKSISFSKLCIEEPIAAYDITEGTHSNGTIAITDGSSAITEAEKDDVVYITATPSTGYSFTSWDVYKTGESTTKVTLTDDDDHGSFSMPDYGVTVDATFSLVDYTLTWDMNGGKVTTEGTGADVDDTGEQSTTLNYGDAITKPIVARDGYKFVGWDDGSGIVTPAATMPAGDVTYTAQWHQQFTITHNLSKTTTESGTVAYENEEYSATYAAVAGYALPTAVLVYRGLTNITASCTWEDGTLTIPGAQITGDITITVRSVRAKCSVSYDGDNPSSGSAPTDSKNYRYGDVVTVKGDNGMTKMDYNFRGWLDDDNDIFYKEGQTFIITDNVTLTAVWESTSGGGGCYEWEGDPDSYTEGSFTADDNLVIVADPVAPGNTAIKANTRISKSPTNKDVTCIVIDGSDKYITGYFDDDEEITSLSIGASSNHDTNTSHIVALFSPYEDFSDDVTCQTVEVPNRSTTYSDATFIKEITPASGTKYFRIYRKINGNQTIGDYTSPKDGVGTNTLQIFYISACSDGGSSDSNFDVTFADGTAVTPASHDEWPSSIVGVPDGKKITVEDPITVGYAFLGWYDDDACSVGHKVDLDNLTVTEDITLYAKWVTNEHTFVGGTEDHEAEWETDGNWESGTAPDTDYPYSYAQVNIKAPAVMATGTKERVGRVDIVNDGSSNTGKLTINSGAMLIVYDRVYRIENTSTNERLATQEDDIYLGSEFGDNYTRHHAGGVNGALVMGKYNGTGVNATVQFACLAWFNSSAYDEEHKWQATDINQYIGIPFNELTPNDYDNHDPEYDRTSSMLYSYETSNNRWYPMIGTDKMAPFVGYDILWIRGSQPKFDLQGTLVASENQTLDLRSYGGASFAEDNETLLANSWAAPINIAKFEVEDFNHAEATIYMFNAGTGVDYGDIGWTYGKTTLPGQYSSLPIEYVKAYYDEYEGFRTIPSMQSFSILTAEDGDASITLDYKRLVYDGAVAYKTIEPMHAPRRAPKASSKPLEIKIAVQGASGLSDVACILEREDFTYGFDNGWEASKLYGIWEVPTLYAVTETGIRAIVAVPNADGQELAFCAGKVDDVYTISFDYSSEAEPLYLYDKETDIYTQVLTGGTYTFTTNDKNDHNRFVLTRSYVPSVATGVDNVEQFNTDVQKVIINDHIYIIRGGRMYSVDGVVVK